MNVDKAFEELALLSIIRYNSMTNHKKQEKFLKWLKGCAWGVILYESSKLNPPIEWRLQKSIGVEFSHLSSTRPHSDWRSFYFIQHLANDFKQRCSFTDHVLSDVLLRLSISNSNDGIRRSSERNIRRLCEAAISIIQPSKHSKLEDIPEVIQPVLDIVYVLCRLSNYKSYHQPQTKISSPLFNHLLSIINEIDQTNVSHHDTENVLSILQPDSEFNTTQIDGLIYDLAINDFSKFRNELIQPHQELKKFNNTKSILFNVGMKRCHSTASLTDKNDSGFCNELFEILKKTSIDDDSGIVMTFRHHTDVIPIQSTIGCQQHLKERFKKSIDVLKWNVKWEMPLDFTQEIQRSVLLCLHGIGSNLIPLTYDQSLQNPKWHFDIDSTIISNNLTIFKCFIQ